MLTDTPEYESFRRFLELTLEARRLRDRLNEIIPQIKKMQPALLGYLGAAGLPSLPVGEYTLYPHREPWVYPALGVSRGAVCAALKAAGMGQMVKENYNTQSLTTYVKQLEQHHHLTTGLNGTLAELLPAPLAKVLAVKPAFSVRVKQKAHGALLDYSEQQQGDESDEESE